MASPTTSLRPEDVLRRIGDTNQRALAYVLEPDPQLFRLSRKVREAILPDLPPVTAGALLGPAALARHFIASASSGRYRDLFALWELFRSRPDECRPELAERQRALEKAHGALDTALRLGLSGHADRVAEDVERAEGLIWQWVRETLLAELPAVGRRPAVASAFLHRQPDAAVPLPAEPDDDWVQEAAAARRRGPLAPPVEALLAANAGRLEASIANLQLAQDAFPERVAEIAQRVDLDNPSIGALLAWARDHGVGATMTARVRDDLEQAAARGRAEGVAAWYEWRERHVDVEPPAAVRQPTLDGLDLSRPDTAALAAVLLADGAPLDPQAIVEELATSNRQFAEKAYEAFVCAGLGVVLPAALLNNPLVKEGTRCPYCQSWTYVRAGHERRCPRRPAGADLTAVPTPPPPPVISTEPNEATDWDAALGASQAAEPAPQPPAPPAADPHAPPSQPHPQPAPPREDEVAVPQLSPDEGDGDPSPQDTFGAAPPVAADPDGPVQLSTEAVPDPEHLDALPRLHRFDDQPATPGLPPV